MKEHVTAAEKHVKPVLPPEAAPHVEAFRDWLGEEDDMADHLAALVAMLPEPEPPEMVTEEALCSCPPGPCLGWAFDAAKCRAVEAHDREVVPDE